MEGAGVARSFNALAAASAAFAADGRIKDAIFSNININRDGFRLLRARGHFGPEDYRFFAMNSRILPSLALMLAVGIFFGYIKPAWSGPLAETKAAIKTNEQALAAADEYKAKQNTLASARNAIDLENLARISTFLPDSVDNVGLILDINALAARSGLSLSNIDVVANDASGAKINTKAPASAGALPVARTNLIGSVDSRFLLSVLIRRSSRSSRE